MMNRKRFSPRTNLAAAIAACLLLWAGFMLPGCAAMRKDRCFLDDARYGKMRDLFTKTGSLQRIEQAMESEGWSTCERNELHYRLTKDLNLEGRAAPGEVQPEFVP